MAATPLKAYVTNCTFANQVVSIAGHNIRLPRLELTSGVRGLNRKQVRERSEDWYNHQVMPLVAEKLLETGLTKDERDRALAQFHKTVNIKLNSCIVASRMADGSAQQIIQLTTAPMPAGAPPASTLMIPTVNLDNSVKVLDTVYQLKRDQENDVIPTYEYNFDFFVHAALQLQGLKPALTNEYNIRTEVMNKFPNEKKFNPNIPIWPNSFNDQKSILKKLGTLNSLFGDIGSDHRRAVISRAFREFYETNTGNDLFSEHVTNKGVPEMFEFSREKLPTFITKEEWEHIDKKMEQLVLYQFLKIIPLIHYIEEVSDIDIQQIIRAYIRDLFLNPSAFREFSPEENALKSFIYNPILERKLDILCVALLPKKTERLATNWQENLRRVSSYIDISGLFNKIKQTVTTLLAEKIVGPRAGKKDTPTHWLKFYLTQFFNTHNVPADQRDKLAKADRAGSFSFTLPRISLTRLFSTTPPPPPRTPPVAAAS